MEIHLPSLHERTDDIPVLAQHFVKNYGQKYRKPDIQISSQAIKRLQKYHWPGNVRELQHAIERAVIMTDSEVISPDEFFFLSGVKESEDVTSGQLNLDEVEKNIIQKAINKYSGNISNAAKELGLTRASLYRRLDKHGL